MMWSFKHTAVAGLRQSLALNSARIPSSSKKIHENVLRRAPAFPNPQLGPLLAVDATRSIGPRLFPPWSIMKLTFTSSVGWFTLAALLALSPQLAGCDTDPKSTLSPRTVSTKQDTPPAATQAGVTKKEGSQPIVAAPAPTREETPKASPDVSKKGEDQFPEVRRFVIASAVDGREPVKLAQGTVDQPVVAFVEMRNLRAEDSKIVVTFEHESGKKVGFIQLAIPKESPRYRTWGRTHNIRDAGKWTAIVATEGGQELARESFSVSS